MVTPCLLFLCAEEAEGSPAGRAGHSPIPRGCPGQLSEVGGQPCPWQVGVSEQVSNVPLAFPLRSPSPLHNKKGITAPF